MEPTRLICPECRLVHRVKNIIPGKNYACKHCGAALARLPDGAAPAVQPAIAAGAVQKETRTAVPSSLAGILSALSEKVERLQAALPGKDAADPAGLAAAIDAVRTDLRLLSEKTDAAGAALARMEEGQKNQLAGAPAVPEIDMDSLADRLAAGMRLRSSPLLDHESGSAVDALARVADELVREQTANSARVDALAGEIKLAVGSLARFDEWKSSLPTRVADEIGHSVEERVVGPISSSLARQAPAILSELQDHKLVDIVSRSVREAQRPFLREVLAGGRGGIPAWLFAVILLPLLLLLGYLFLPGQFGGAAGSADVITRLRQEGVALTPDADARLMNVEEAVLDIHAQAMAHANNAGALEQEVKNLRAALGERDRLIEEYNTTLDQQMKRLAEYERRLIQLGISPTAAE